VKADVIGKVYPPGPLAGQVWQTMGVLQERAASVGVMTPRPLAIIDEWNLILMDRVPGTSLKKSLWKANSEIEGEQAVKLAAAALAALHNIPFEGRDVRTLETDLETLRLQAAPVHLIAPGLAGDVDAMLDQVAQSPIGTGSNAVSFLHGDFAPSQLLVDGERVGVVDFDKSCLGESAIDVGNFLAKLHRRAVVKGKDYYRGLARLFLDGYRELSPESVSEERARLFRALSLVRMAIHTFQRSPGSYARDREFSLPARLLREAAACLEGA
jgi:aminoglycoside phosphotransferase (APT) family kinase protein